MFQQAPKNSFGFPFEINQDGGIKATGGDEAIRGKIIQILLTTPGERVHQPEFGCGLLNTVFDGNDDILAATLQFTIGQALGRWIGDEITVDGVNVRSENEFVIAEVAYTKRLDLQQQAVRIQFR